MSEYFDKSKTETAAVIPAGIGKLQPPREPYPYGYYDDDAASEGLLEYWYILKRRKGAITLFCILGMLLAVLYTLPQTPVYKTTAAIEIQVMNPDFMKMYQVSPVDDVSQTWDNNDIQTQLKILESKTLADRVIKRLEKERPANETGAKGRVSAWRRALNLPMPEPADERSAVLAQTAGSLHAANSDHTRIVEISIDSTSPELAAEFANAYCDEYIQMNLESRWQMSQRTGEWLSNQLEDLRIKLEQSEADLQAYARKSGLMYTAERGSVAEDKLRQLQTSLSEAQAERVARQSRYDIVQKSPPESLADVLSDESLRHYQVQLTKLRQQEAELNTTFTPEHDSVRRVQAQIKAVETAFQNERNAIIHRIWNDFEESTQRENLLTMDYEAQAELVNHQSTKAVQYKILLREVESNRDLYEGMLEQVKSAAISSALRASNIRVVDAAEIPLAPYKPNLIRNTSMGLMLAGFLGVVFFVAREKMDRSIRQPGDVSSFLDVLELGTIPDANCRTAFRLVYRPKPGKLLPEPITVTTKSFSDRVELVTARGKPSVVAESFRATLTSILFSTSGAAPRLITITSANPSEGKTTVTANLAVALADVGRKTLLIDADMRRPRIHGIFETERSNGLSEVLLGKADFDDEGLKRLLRETGVANLSILPSGESVGESTKLLYSSRMAELLERLEREFDTILIDTPPVGQIPDARVLGRMSQGVILVVRAGSTTRDAAQSAYLRFQEDGTKVIGSILNLWDPASSGKDDQYYDRYYDYRRAS